MEYIWKPNRHNFYNSLIYDVLACRISEKTGCFKRLNRTGK